MGTEISQASVEAFAKNMLTGLIALLTEHLPAAQEAELNEDRATELAEEAASYYLSDNISEAIWDEVPSWVSDFDADEILSTDNVEDIATERAQHVLDSVSWDYDYDLVTKDTLADAVSGEVMEQLPATLVNQLPKALSAWLREPANQDSMLDMLLERMLHLVRDQKPL